jgi:23S rRNA (cytidine1920-2'-O)/16S rRNA (cytidine1409-2'-O)-methyltransferase
MERTNARYVNREDLSGPVDLVVIDASFIGLEKLLPAAYEILVPGGEVLALIKPQFQVGQDKVGKGGVVRDMEVRREAVRVLVRDAEQIGFERVAEADSVLVGPKGNQETFIWLSRPAKERAP